MHACAHYATAEHTLTRTYSTHNNTTTGRNHTQPFEHRLPLTIMQPAKIGSLGGSVELRCMRLVGLMPFAIDRQHGRNAVPTESRWLAAYSCVAAIVAVIIAGLSLRMFALEFSENFRRHSNFRKAVMIEDILMALQVGGCVIVVFVA